MIKIEINDKQIMDFARKSPARSRWALAEALKMAGGHLRKQLREYIEKGGEGWPPLKPITQSGKRGARAASRLTGIYEIAKRSGTPLFGFGKMVRFKYGRSMGAQAVRVGFLDSKLAKIIRIHEYGKRIRVTPGLRALFGKRGFFLKKTTQWLQIPRRPMIEWLWRKNKNTIPGYVEKHFFKKFFSSEKPGIGF